MTTYPHFQELKKSEDLPKKDQVGACLTCRFWDAPLSRGLSSVPTVGLCLQKDLKPFGLVVSGSSACNAWKEQPKLKPEAKEYAERGETES